MKTYIFKVELEQEEDGRWSAWIPVLPGCATWGHTKEDALQNLHDAAHAYIETLIEDGRPIPAESNQVEVIEAPAVAVTV